MGSREMSPSCQAGPPAEREGQGLADHVSWTLGEASGAAGACRVGRDREVPSGQSSTGSGGRKQKAPQAAAAFRWVPFGHSMDTTGQAHPESHCSFLFLPFSVSELPASRAPQTRGLCPATVGA